jgi:SAM-dependent methyltransferase
MTSHVPSDQSAGVRLRAGLRRGVLSSPPAVQRALRSGSERLIRVLDAAGPNGVSAPAPSPVWQSPPPPLPEGLSLADIEEIFGSWSVNGEPVGHLEGYVWDSKLRFLHTWGIVKDASGSCLELGANPYFTTYLLDEHTDLDLTLANYYGTKGNTTETVSFVRPGSSERTELSRISQMFNVEEDEFPFDGETFEVVLFCEMLEHLLMDPTATLRQIHRILKPNGTLVLTTPNVARLNNVLALVNGANMYDPYSGFGPYGRHNREYTRHELHRLLEFLGFDVEYSFAADGHTSDAESWPQYAEVAPLVEYRREDLGHYLFVKARKTREPRTGLPSFLFRSWPEDSIVEYG